jgi:hypothetical protein
MGFDMVEVPQPDEENSHQQHGLTPSPRPFVPFEPVGAIAREPQGRKDDPTCERLP